MTGVLHDLARAAGLEPTYSSWYGEPRVASDAAIVQMLKALAPELGIAIGGEVDATAALRELEQRKWRELVPPVVLAWDAQLEVPFAVPAERDGEWELVVTTESGAHHTARGRLFELPADSHAWPGGVVHCTRRARLSLGGELGYHVVQWRAGDASGEAMVIAAPVRAFGGPGQGPRRWGVFAPAYGLAAPESGPSGDLSTLRRLFDAVDRRGGSYIGTLPLLANFLDEPFEPSPYSPASRMYWNELYLDLGALARDAGVATPAPPPIVPGQRIDYRAEYRRRRAAIDALAPRVLERHRDAIDAWARSKGAYDYALFRAFGEVARTSWRAWEPERRDGVAFAFSREAALAIGGDAARIDSHVVAQWAMQRQLDALRAGRVQLYLDLPVGVYCDAYEVWRWRSQFLVDVAIGAPPDPLCTAGQNWQLPPLSPFALRRDRYRYFIACVRHHMSGAGMLRIDHVMGLFRLYCVPSGFPATEGLYLRYHAEELLAILTLESLRARCAVAGEDLGTVPDHVRPTMARHGLYRLFVRQWHMAAHVGERPPAPPAESIVSLNTHDAVPWAGWWRGADIDIKVRLGLASPDDERRLRDERDERKRAALAIGEPVTGDPLTEVERALVTMTTELATGPAEIVMVAMDDLALDPAPQNVPGTTSSEQPNWSKPVEGWDRNLDRERASPAAAATIAAIVAARS